MGSTINTHSYMQTYTYCKISGRGIVNNYLKGANKDVWDPQKIK